MATIAEIRARKLAKINQELETDERKQKARRKKHRLAWRREYAKKKKLASQVLPPGQVGRLNLATNPLWNDRQEQKRAGRIRWRFNTGTGDEVRTLTGWCDYIAAETGVPLTPVDLEAILHADESYSLDQILECARYLTSE